MNHEQRRAKGRTTNTEPSATDQSQARDTDINVIVGQFAVTHTVRGNAGEPIYADFTQLPDNLRDFIEQSRSVEQLRQQLPEQLRNHTPEQLNALTADDLKRILTPPAPPPAPEPKP